MFMSPVSKCLHRASAPIWAGVVALLLARAAAAEPPELVTDRPDQTESAETVPPGYIQIELGGTMSHEDRDDLQLETIEGPGILVRVGLSERVELRLGWQGWVSEDFRFHATDQVAASRSDRSGQGDTDLGFKLRLHSGGGSSPQVALMAGASIPTGDDEFTSDAADPYFRLSVAHTLTDRIGFGYNLGAQRETDPAGSSDRQRTTSFLYTTVLGFSLSDRLGAFVELFGQADEGSAGETSTSFDAGLTFLARPGLQFDLAAGIGLSDAAGDWFVGLGLSLRLPD